MVSRLIRIRFRALSLLPLLAGCGNDNDDAGQHGDASSPIFQEARDAASDDAYSDASDAHAESSDARVEVDAAGQVARDSGEDLRDGRSCSRPCDDTDAGSCSCDFDAVCGHDFDWEALDGKACPGEGTHCYWPDACSGPECWCQENAEGEAVWQCAVRLC
jgi:hypothetical protein